MVLRNYFCHILLLANDEYLQKEHMTFARCPCNKAEGRNRSGVNDLA